MLVASQVRSVLRKLPDIAAQETLNPPELSRVYIPSGHHKALSLDASIVVGMRGAGKSLWTAVLSSDEHRAFVAEVTGIGRLAELEVRVGFGLDDSNKHFPSERVMASLLESNIDPLTIWQTVVLKHASNVSGIEMPHAENWVKATRWTKENQEEVEELFAQCDEELEEQGIYLLVLFDALDRLASEWQGVRKLLTAALRFSLQCRSRRMIRLKLFLRPDMEEDAEIWRFPDSSKLRHSKVELTWRTVDLYGLIFLQLANSKSYGEGFRNALYDDLGVDWIERKSVFPVPRQLTTNEERTRYVVDEIAGKWVGRSPKRGFTYTWIPTHLADAVGQVSPRSFLLAFQRAAEFTEENHPDYKHALHFEGIQHGVAEASKIRIEEIKEDYPWVDPLLQAAKGLTVPCDPGELVETWTKRHLNQVTNAAEKLPPRRFSADPLSKFRPGLLIDDLVELAVLYWTEDGRINIPDIFRVGFGIKRKGGVRPPR